MELKIYHKKGEHPADRPATQWQAAHRQLPGLHYQRAEVPAKQRVRARLPDDRRLPLPHHRLPLRPQQHQIHQPNRRRYFIDGQSSNSQRRGQHQVMSLRAIPGARAHRTVLDLELPESATLAEYHGAIQVEKPPQHQRRTVHIPRPHGRRHSLIPSHTYSGGSRSIAASGTCQQHCR